MGSHHMSLSIRLLDPGDNFLAGELQSTHYKQLQRAGALRCARYTEAVSDGLWPTPRHPQGSRETESVCVFMCVPCGLLGRLLESGCKGCLASPGSMDIPEDLSRAIELRGPQCPVGLSHRARGRSWGPESRAGSDSDTHELSTSSCRGHSDEQDRQVPVAMELLVLEVVVGFAGH